MVKEEFGRLVPRPYCVRYECNNGQAEYFCWDVYPEDVDLPIIGTTTCIFMVPNTYWPYMEDHQ